MKVSVACDTEITTELQWVEFNTKLQITSVMKAQSMGMDPSMMIAQNTSILLDSLWSSLKLLNASDDEKFERIKLYLEHAVASYKILRVEIEKG